MTRILITGTGGTGLGASLIHALRQAGDRWEIIAADAEPFSWGLYAADHGVLVPWADDPGYLPWLQEIIARYQVAAVIPGTEAETVLLAQQDLPVPVIVNRAELMPLMRDKQQAARWLADHGLPFVPAYPWVQRQLAVTAHGFPLVVKPGKNSSGSRGLFLVISERELEGLDAFVTPHSIIQPYLGDADHEYSVSVLSGQDGQVFGSLVIHRQLTGFSLHTQRDYQGQRIAVSTGFTQGFLVKDAKIQAFCEDLARRLGSAGVLDLQLRMHGGQPHVFEIQPRFSFSAAFRATAGFNEPDVLLRHRLDGYDPGRLDYTTGAIMRAFGHLLVPELLS
jgi:carbamoyl-phosphate synthase large subunit